MGRNLLDYREYRASTSWSDLLEQEARDKKPWKKVALAVFLCLTGVIMLTTGIVLWYQSPVDGLGEAAFGQRHVLEASRFAVPEQRPLSSGMRVQEWVICLQLTHVPTPCCCHLPAAIALLVLGSICFLPGFYHTRIAYLAWRGVAGYSLSDIPDM